MTDGSIVLSYVLRICSWDDPREPKSYDRLFVSHGHDADKKERALVNRSPDLVTALRALRGADQRGASDYSRERFAAMLEARAVFDDEITSAARDLAGCRIA